MESCLQRAQRFLRRPPELLRQPVKVPTSHLHFSRCCISTLQPRPLEFTGLSVLWKSRELMNGLLPQRVVSGGDETRIADITGVREENILYGELIES